MSGADMGGADMSGAHMKGAVTSGVDTPEGFTRLLHEELDIDLTQRELATDLDELPVWDSVYLLRLVTALEEHLGRRLPVRMILEARTLEQIRELAANGGRTRTGGER